MIPDSRTLVPVPDSDHSRSKITNGLDTVVSRDPETRQTSQGGQQAMMGVEVKGLLTHCLRVT